MSDQNSTIRKGYLRLIARTILFLLVIYIFFTKILCFQRVEGMQMFPSLKDGDLTLSYCLKQTFRPNDVIIYEVNGEKNFGRIIAVGGNEINIDGSGDVKINGISESGEIIYPSYHKGDIKYPYQIPEGSVFVLGDYRAQTKDSREFGAIKESQIKGKVLTILRRRGI